ncbi:MAG: PKD domain-containing protein [Bdellovibrionota bacterium]
MRKLLLATLALCLLSTAAPAQAKTPNAVKVARALLKRLKAHPPKKSVHTLDTPLLRFLPSPSTAIQGANFTVIAESINNFPGRILSLDVSLNGGPTSTLSLIDNGGMFSIPLGVQNLVGANTMNASLYLENSADNAAIRTSIKNLDTNISHLTTQINADRDPADRANLEEQRSEQLALKNELVNQLRVFRTLIGSQQYNYSVQSNVGTPGAPAVTALSPSSGDVRGGTLVNITGSNFSPNVSVKFGGVASPSVTFVSATSVTAYTPDFVLGTGAKDVELDFNVGGIVSNVIVPGGYFATNVVPVAPTKPVAVASGSQQIRLGDSASLDGSQSYDNRVTSLSYKWTVVSAPANSNYSAGQNVGSSASLTVTPSALGSFVFSLVVTEVDTVEKLVSSPSIVQVQVGSGPQPLAPSITLERGTSGTSQIIPNDSDVGSSVFYTLTQAPVHGSVTISSSGLCTYQASTTYVGLDPFTVRVTNQSGLFADVVIPVNAVEFNHAPVPTAPAITSHTEAQFAQISPNEVDQGQIFTYAILEPALHGTASVDSNGKVSYAPNSGYQGADEVVVKVSNSASTPLIGLADVNITVLPNSTPQLSAPSLQLGSGNTATSQSVLTDDAGQTGTYSVSTPSNGTATVSQAGLVTYTAGSGFTGSDSVTLSYTDNGNPALTGSLVIPVTGVLPPTANAPGITLATGGSATSQISVTPGNPGRTYVFSVSTPPASGSAVVSPSGLVTYTSAAPFTGSDSVGIMIADSLAPSIFITISVPVTVTVNHAPTGSAPSITATAGAYFTSQVSASDQDPGQTVSYSIPAQPAHGIATVSTTGLVTYITAVTTNSSDSVNVAVTDNGTPQLTTLVTVPVSITSIVGQPPVIPPVLVDRIFTQGVPYQVGMGINSGKFPTGLVHPNGPITSVIWDFGDGTREKGTDMVFGSILHNYMATGNYTATITVTDSIGLSSSATLNFNVVDAPIPTAKFSISPFTGGPVPLTVTLDASASSAPNGIGQYLWVFCGAAPEISTTSPVITHTFTTAPGCNVRLRVIDSASAVTGQTNAFVFAGNPVGGAKTVANFLVGPPREQVGSNPFTFDGSYSFNPNAGGVPITVFNWNFGDPACSGGCTATGVTTSHSYSFGGFNRFVSLTVANAFNNVSQPFSWEVFPVVAAGTHIPHGLIYPSATSGVAPFTVQLDGSWSYGYGEAISGYSWFFGDGTSDFTNVATTSHTFTAPGSYLVTLQVGSPSGNGNAVTQTITVRSARDEAPRTGGDTPEQDPSREYQRQVLAGGCANGIAASCAGLANMYSEDGDTFTAQQLNQKACSMGYQPACGQ